MIRYYKKKHVASNMTRTPQRDSDEVVVNKISAPPMNLFCIIIITILRIDKFN